MKNLCQLIVNADDLGWAPGRDRGIFRTIECGIVTSVSLFANGATFAAAVAELQQHPVAVGVHLNLSEGRALTGPIRGLTDDSGMFLNKAASRAAFAAAQFDLAAAEQELHTQLQRVLDGGLVVDHLDSHQHMFLFPALTPMMIRLCRHFNLSAVRLPLPAEDAAEDPGGQLGRELALYRNHAPALQRLTAQAHLVTPRGLWGMPLLDRLDETALLAVLEQLPAGCWELMVHPGEQDRDLPFCGIERVREQDALIAAATRRAVERHGIELTTFGALACAS